MPVPRWLKSFIAEQRPDVVLVSPLVDFGSGQGDYVRRAQSQGIPTVLVVAEPDDLRTKGGIRDVPTLTVVSSDEQAEEAVRLQGLPRDRVVAVATEPQASAEQGVVKAIEEAAPAEVVRSHRGLLLRPVLLALTPLLLVLLPLIRPRATARGIARWGRDRRRLRIQRQREEQARAALERKEKAHAAKLEAKAQARAAKELERQEAKQAKKRKLEQAAKAQERKRAEEAKEPGEAEAANEPEGPQAETAKKADAEARAAAADQEPKVKPPKEKPPKEKLPKETPPKEKPPAEAAVAAVAAAPEKGRKPKDEKGRGRSKTFRGRMSKQMRARARTVRRGLKQGRRSVRRTYNRRYRWTYQKTIHRVPARDELPALLNARGLLGQGVEIGVKAGKYSDELLSNWHGAQLISIDPWMEAEWDEYVDRSNVAQGEHERYYQMTRERLAPYGERSSIWRMTSLEGAERVEPHSLDFAYIDARHDYESVKEDLAAWCDKVRPGGILAGHDYVDGDFEEGEFYVKSAVDEFFGERGIPVHGTEGPSAVESFPTWIVVVPEEGIKPPSA
jgi:hypothetical protein